jgi:hypothetical protein
MDNLGVELNNLRISTGGSMNLQAITQEEQRRIAKDKLNKDKGRICNILTTASANHYVVSGLVYDVKDREYRLEWRLSALIEKIKGLMNYCFGTSYQNKADQKVLAEMTYQAIVDAQKGLKLDGLTPGAFESGSEKELAQKMTLAARRTGLLPKQPWFGAKYPHECVADVLNAIKNNSSISIDLSKIDEYLLDNAEEAKKKAADIDHLQGQIAGLDAQEDLDDNLITGALESTQEFLNSSETSPVSEDEQECFEENEKTDELALATQASTKEFLEQELQVKKETLKQETNKNLAQEFVRSGEDFEDTQSECSDVDLDQDFEKEDGATDPETVSNRSSPVSTPPQSRKKYWLF